MFINISWDSPYVTTCKATAWNNCLLYWSTGLSPCYSLLLIQLPANAKEGEDDGPIIGHKFPTVHVRHLDGVSDSWFQAGPTLTVACIGGLKQQMEDISVSFALCLSSTWKKKS